MLLCACSNLLAHAQIGDYLNAEDFYARTKQVNQFIRRFNGEETLRGQRLLPTDRNYHGDRLRKRFLPQLIDQQNKQVADQLQAFGERVLDANDPQFLDFYNPNWFAEVRTMVDYQGKQMPMTFFLTLEEVNGGWKWVIDRINFAPYDKLFNMNHAPKKFLNPMSHELYFMPLEKAMNHPENLEDYIQKGYQPNTLTVFLADMKRGLLKFERVSQVNLHFFQVKGWYFQVSEINRAGKNAGWLMTNLVQADQPTKEKLKAYIQEQE